MSDNIQKDDTVKTVKKPRDLEKEEINGPKGLEPTRYGDWQVKGRVSDF